MLFNDDDFFKSFSVNYVSNVHADHSESILMGHFFVPLFNPRIQ